MFEALVLLELRVLGYLVENMKTFRPRITVLIIAILVIVSMSIASYYIRQTPYTTIPVTDTMKNLRMPTSTTTPVPYTRDTSISRFVTPTITNRTYLFELGNWTIIIELAGNGKGVLAVKYTGSRPLVVENPLLPPIAGLNIILSYYDPSKDTVIRKSGTYYYNTSIEIKPGDESKVCFNAKGLRLIRVEGRILGKIPVRIMLPLSTMVSEPCMCTETITITKIVTIHQTTQTTTTGYCEFIKEAEYLEPPRNNSTRTETGNETIISDGTLRIHVPLMVSEPRIPLTFETREIHLYGF